MKKVFISQPMRGFSSEMILDERCRIVKKVEDIFNGEEIEVVESYFKECPSMACKNSGLWYLGKSISLMSQADVVFFGKEWKSA